MVSSVLSNRVIVFCLSSSSGVLYVFVFLKCFCGFEVFFLWIKMCFVISLSVVLFSMCFLSFWWIWCHFCRLTRSSWEFWDGARWQRGDVSKAKPLIRWGNRTGVTTMMLGCGDEGEKMFCLIFVFLFSIIFHVLQESDLFLDIFFSLTHRLFSGIWFMTPGLGLLFG